jgi:hypothetical protein
MLHSEATGLVRRMKMFASVGERPQSNVTACVSPCPCGQFARYGVHTKGCPKGPVLAAKTENK